MNNKFTPKAQKALNQSLKVAEKFGHTYIGTEHLLLALAEEELSCSSLILSKYYVTATKMNSMIKEYSGTGTKSALTSKDITPRAKNILENAYTLAIKFGNGTIGTEHILLAILEEKDSVAVKLLKKSKVDTAIIRDEIYSILKVREKQNTNKTDMNAPLLRQYGKNLCEMAKNEKFDPVIGRDRETDRIIRILSRKTKNNPCLIGEAGVGKTAIIEGLAERVVSGKVPDSLKGKNIISIDLTSMVAGAKYRGDFEDRIKNLLAEAVKNDNIILFIDEIHTIVGAGAAEGAIDASNILKPQLARGDLQLIGATTLSEYHKYIEKDAALERRFQPVIVEEPDKKRTIEMLMGLKGHYERHHNVKIDDDAIRDCVYLSEKFINDRYFPDKAIDVLDEACVIAKNSHNIGDKTEQFSKNITESVISNDILSAFYNEHSDMEIKKSFCYVDSEDVRTAISEICNIPKCMIKNELNYSEINEALNTSLPGHQKEISRIIKAIKKHDLGFSDYEKPRGVFLFVGESGTGKTAMAIELSKKIFFGNKSLIRYDMSEFSEKHSVSKLIGSPPGYAGHDDGGGLTEAVRKRPHSLVLFDEIEKADKDILNILLQISDYGYLTDSSGRHVNFKNAVIIMTSNIGTNIPYSGRKTGFIESNAQNTEEHVMQSLKIHYTSEFLNRFDEIIVFEKPTCAALSEIAEKKLLELSNKMGSCGHKLRYDDNVTEFLANLSKNKIGGVRALLKDIGDLIEKPLIELIVNLDNESYDINVSIFENTIRIQENKSLKI